MTQIKTNECEWIKNQIQKLDWVKDLEKLDNEGFIELAQHYTRLQKKVIKMDMEEYIEQEKIDKIKLRDVEHDLKSYISEKYNVSTEYRDENGDLVFIMPTRSKINPFENIESLYFIKENGELGINYDVIDLEE